MNAITHPALSADTYESIDEYLVVGILYCLSFNGASPRSSGVRQSADPLSTFQRVSESTR